MYDLNLYNKTENKLNKCFSKQREIIKNCIGLGHTPENSDCRPYLKYLHCIDFADKIFQCFEELCAGERSEGLGSEKATIFHRQIKDIAKHYDDKISTIKSKKVDSTDALKEIIDLCIQGLDKPEQDTLMQARQVINQNVNETNFEKSKEIRQVLNDYLNVTEDIAEKELNRHKKQILEINNEKQI